MYIITISNRFPVHGKGDFIVFGPSHKVMQVERNSILKSEFNTLKTVL